MKKLEIEDIKQLSFEVLCKVADVCEQYNISYSLTGGTLIGAVRHKGFIPWDDDIDIMMPRPDYDRFISIVGKEDYGFDLYSIETCGEVYWYPFAKACHRDTILKEKATVDTGMELGVYVDIFPVDGIAKNAIVAKVRCVMFQFLHGLKITSRWKKYKKSKLRKWYYEPLRYICYLLCKLLSQRWIDQIVERFTRKIPYQTSKFAGRLVGDFGSKEIMKKSLFDNITQLEFEGRYFDVVEDYDFFLRKLYGDYMQLPSLEKRVTHHEFEAYRINND